MTEDQAHAELDERLKRAAVQDPAPDSLREDLRRLELSALTGGRGRSGVRARPNWKTQALSPAGADGRRSAREAFSNLTSSRGPGSKAATASGAGSPSATAMAGSGTADDAALDRGAAAPSASQPGGLARYKRPTMIVAGAIVAVLILLSILKSNGNSTPAVRQIVPLATLSPAGNAPVAHGPQAQHQLSAQIQGLYMPDLSAQGWRAYGTRADEVKGRRVTTVFYSQGGRRIAISCLQSPVILSNSAFSHQLNTGRLGGRNVVAWNLQNHTCVVSGADSSTKQLQALSASTR